MATSSDTDTQLPIMSRLLDCSHEVLQSILTYSEPADLGALSQTCRSLNVFIRGNVVLAKELYLQRYDFPSNAEARDWETELHNVTKLDLMLNSPDEDYKRSSLAFAAPTILSMLSIAHPTKNISFLKSHFRSQTNMDSLLTASSLYQHAGVRNQKPADTPQLRQLAAKLHVYYGVPAEQERERPPTLSSRSTTGPSYQVRHEEPAEGGRHRIFYRPTPRANCVARAKVYDLREYTMKSLWGPFKGDGSMEVDWEKVEAIMVLMGHNLSMWSHRVNPRSALWYRPWEGLGPGSFPSRSEELAAKLITEASDDFYDTRSEEEKKKEQRQAELDAQDPYGITGAWMRVVCFLDYNDLYAFNFSNERRQRDREDGISTDEAIRLICLKLKVTDIRYPTKKNGNDEDSDSSSDFDPDEMPTAPPVSGANTQTTAEDANPGAQDSPMDSAQECNSNPYAHMPIVTFQGTSCSIHNSWDPNANSRIRGIVRTTRHGDVRWTTWSIFHGEERWRSEGVQVGGARSRRGVMGNWFDKDYDRYGPAGPTAFWKISNDVTFADLSSDGSNSAHVRHELLRFLWHNGPDDDSADDDREEDPDFINGGDDVQDTDSSDEEGNADVGNSEDGDTADAVRRELLRLIREEGVLVADEVHGENIQVEVEIIDERDEDTARDEGRVWLVEVDGAGNEESAEGASHE